MILIEGPPFAKELVVLKDKFLVARFPDVFKNTKLPPRRVLFSTTPPPTLIPPSYAATIGRPVDTDAVRIDDAYSPSVTIHARKDYPVLQNSRGQRLNALISPPQSLVNMMRTTKHYNTFHILRECTYNNCSFLHRVRLDEKGIEARRFLLRYTLYLSRLQCKDEKYLLGHQCPDRACAKIGRGCRFTREIYNIDRS
jgi:hypothetical protein